MAVKTTHCIVTDCSRTSLKRGMCNKHYLRWWRYGDALAGKTGHHDAKKLVSNLLQAPPTEECISLPFGRGGNGYGKLTVDGKSVGTHRYVCELVHGSPDEGMLALHSCGNGHLGCVNPKHLRWGTYSDNYQDSVDHGTAILGEKNPKSKLSEVQAREILALKGIETQAALAKRYGVNASCISMIQSGKNWPHISSGSMVSLYRIETLCGLMWTGAGFSYDDRDALEFDTEDEAITEVVTLDLQEVTVEKITRYSATPQPKTYNATEARAA